MENPRTIEEMLVKEKRMTENQLARARILTGSARERERLRLPSASAFRLRSV